MLSIEFLKTFLAAVDAGSFTRAAAAVHRTQSAVSMQMKRLEEEIGKPLFVRNRKMLALTGAGELLIEHARRIVQSHEDAVAEFQGPALSGKIRFGGGGRLCIGGAAAGSVAVCSGLSGDTDRCLRGGS